MSVPEVNPIIVWPLGTIILIPNSVIPIIKNVGAQSAGEDDLGNAGVMPNARNFTSTCQQLEFSTPSTNRDDVVVTDGIAPGLDTNRTVLIIPPGKRASIPNRAMLKSGVIDVTRYYVQGVAEDRVTIVANEAS